MSTEPTLTVDPVTRRRLLLGGSAASFAVLAAGMLSDGGAAGATADTAGLSTQNSDTASGAALSVGFTGARSGAGYLMLGYADFAERSDAKRSYVSDGLFGGPTGEHRFVAPLHLPGGTRITGIEAIVDSPLVGGGAISVILTEYRPRGGTKDIQSGTAPAGSGEARISAPLGKAYVVDPAASALSVVVASEKAANRVFGVRVEYEGPAGLTLVAQTRIVDTRTDNTRYAGGERTISVAEAVGRGTRAALVNLTVTQTGSQGFLGLYPSDVKFPGTSSINWSSAGTTVANTTIVALGADRAFKLRGSGETHYLVDVIGALS